MSAMPKGLLVRVAKRTDEATDICSFELVAAGGEMLPAFSAGSHIDVAVAPGLARQYSLCNDPAETHRYQIAVLRKPDSRGGSAGLHERLQVGHELHISAPRNHFPLAHGAKHSILLAGGIGVTPILCMAERLAVAGASFDMHYCTRSPARTAFHDRILGSSFVDRVSFHFSEPIEPSQKFDMQKCLASPQPGTHVYVCGPQGFMQAVLDMARSRGWPEDQLHHEFFSADVSPLETDCAFQVRLASSGRTVTVAKHESVVQALMKAGVEVLTSCEQGVCGTCITRVLEGAPDHRDQYLTPQEQAANDQFTPCCSRSRSPMLVLDL